MITLVLLPFLLASRISVDLESLFHGPEYTYRVQVNMINIDEYSGKKTKAFDVSNTLKCRPRVPDTLSCRFEAAKIYFFEGNFLDSSQDITDVLWVHEEPFEIKFQKSGITELIVTRSMKPWTIDMIRAIVNQLNIGVDLRNKPDGVYMDKERSFLGVCQAKIELSHSISQDSWKDDKLEIVPMPGIRKTTGEILQIEKTRDLNDCIPKEDYFFASRSGYSVLNQDATMSVKSSLSRIIVSDSNFTSFTANEIIVTSKDKSKNYTLFENITLNLETVTAAKTELPLIPDGTLVSFFVHGHTHDDGNESRRTESRHDR